MYQIKRKCSQWATVKMVIGFPVNGFCGSGKALAFEEQQNYELLIIYLQSNGDLKRKWTWAVEWLGDELERRPYTGNPQYTYNNWSPPVQSNETSNGYFLERSHSARITLAKACELCPEEVKN